jgi:hypothetical protein
MGRRSRLFVLLLLLSVIASTLVWVRSLRSGPPLDALRSALFLGLPLLEVRAPTPEAEVPVGGIEVLVHFRDEGVLADTFRCTLNGVDVTDQLTLGLNGAVGAIAPLRDGENRLHLEVFGRGWLGDRYYLEAAELRIHVRPAIHLDQA